MNDTRWRWAAISYVVALHLLLAVLIVKTDFIPRLTAKLEVLAGTPKTRMPDMARAHLWMDESVPDKAAIFLGDSITQGLATAAIAPYSINYGIGGESSAQLLEVIPIYKSLSRASLIFLAIGINDLREGMNGGLNDRYQKLINALPPKTPLIWSAVMPARDKYVGVSEITSANKFIKTICANRGNCVYVDTWKFLADKNGQIIKRKFLDDGIHLSPEGYSAWITALKQAIKVIPLADAQPVNSQDGNSIARHSRGELGC